MADDTHSAAGTPSAVRRNVLIIGGGGREHALAWAVAQHPQCGTVHCAPGNAGTAAVARNVEIDGGPDWNGDAGVAVVDFCRGHDVSLVIIGPELPLTAGLADTLRAAGIPTFGPGAVAARLEGSKAFTKALCAAEGIPTARSRTFNDRDAALAYAANHPLPVVIKADGLAAGKGVVIAATRDAALAGVEDCFSGRFGAAGATVVIEAFLTGEEASLFAITDGEAVVLLPAAQDHKRVGDGDTGPNTGGMGAYAPAPVVTADIRDRALDTIIRPTLRALREAGTPFSGVLYAGLMLTAEGPQLIEYNVRFGDPECQALMCLLGPLAFELIAATADGQLAFSADHLQAQVDACAAQGAAALTVVMANTGYPGASAGGAVISGLDAAAEMTGVTVFHAGTALTTNGEVCVKGGRVLNITAAGPSLQEARDRAYAGVAAITWEGAFVRTDIGARALKPARSH